MDDGDRAYNGILHDENDGVGGKGELGQKMTRSGQTIVRLGMCR
jgi:hypothetical protein